MRIAHSATTPQWTFHLDEDGICQSVVPTPGKKGVTFRALTPLAHGCVGAQFVAAVDRKVPGGVAATPRVGEPMLFAYVDGDGRIRLLRTGPVLAFTTFPKDPLEYDDEPAPHSSVRNVTRLRPLPQPPLRPLPPAAPVPPRALVAPRPAAAN
jgi:hypothetical protein